MFEIVRVLSIQAILLVCLEDMQNALHKLKKCVGSPSRATPHSALPPEKQFVTESSVHQRSGKRNETEYKTDAVQSTEGMLYLYHPIPIRSYKPTS